MCQTAPMSVCCVEELTLGREKGGGTDSQFHPTPSTRSLLNKLNIYVNVCMHQCVLYIHCMAIITFVS